MIRIKRGSHAYVLLCFMGLIGELPYKSLHLLGNAQTVRRVVEKMCVKEEYINDETKEVFEVKAFIQSGAGNKHTIRLSKKALKLLDWVGMRKFYDDVTYNCNMPGDEVHVYRNHRMAEVLFMMYRAGANYLPTTIPILEYKGFDYSRVKSTCFYPSRLIKNMNEDESVKLKYILALGAVLSPYASYVVYNTRDKAMRWNGIGEQKARIIIDNLVGRNTKIEEMRSCLLFANNGQAILETLKNSLKKRAVKGKNGRWYRETPVSVVDVYNHVHYIPLNETGIRMLRIMFLPNYQERIQNVIYTKPLLDNKWTIFDGRNNDWYYINHFDGDIGKLYYLKGFLEVQPTKCTMVCFDFQYDYLKSYLGNLVNYKVFTIEQLEELLKIKGQAVQ